MEPCQAGPGGAAEVRSVGDFYRRSHAMLADYLARSVETAGADRGAALRAADVHRHLSKYQAAAVEAMTSDDPGVRGGARAAAQAFFTEFDVLAAAGGPPPAAGGSPSDEDLAGFREKIRRFNALDDEERALRAQAAERRRGKSELSASIIAFMQRHGLDDVTTKAGTLRCVHRRCRAPLSRSAMAERIRSFFGDDSESAEALRGNLFEGGDERESVSLRRLIPKQSR